MKRLLVLFVYLGIITIILCFSTTTKNNHHKFFEPITSQNINQIEKTATFGRGEIYDIAWSPNGITLAVASSRGVWLYRTDDWSLEPRLLPVDTYDAKVKFSPDGKWLILIDMQGNLSLWDASTFELKNHIQYKTPTENKFSNGIEDIVFSGDSNFFVTVMEDDAIKMWDTETQTIKNFFDLEQFSGLGNPIAWSPDGRYIATSGHGKTLIYDLKLGVYTHEFAVTWNNDVVFSPDSKYLFVNGCSSYCEGITPLTYYSIESGEIEVLSDIELYHVIVDLLISHDGKTLFASDGHGKIISWNTANLQTKMVIHYPTKISDAQPGQLALSPDGEFIAATDDSVHVYRVETGQLLHSLTGFSSSAYDIALSPDGKILAKLYDVINPNATNFEQQLHEIQFYDTHTGILQSTIDFASYGATYEMEFSSDGQRVAVFGFGKMIKVYDVQTGEKLHQIEFADSPRAIAFSHNGVWLAAAPCEAMDEIAGCSGDGEIHLIDALTFETLHILRGHTQFISDLLFTSDDTRLVSYSYDNTLRIWDLQTLQEIKSIHAPNISRGSLTISPIAPVVAYESCDVGSNDPYCKSTEVHLIDLNTYQTFFFADCVYCGSLTFSPDGSLLGNSNLMWHVKDGQLMEMPDKFYKRDILFNPSSTHLYILNSTFIELWQVIGN